MPRNTTMTALAGVLTGFSLVMVVPFFYGASGSGARHPIRTLLGDRLLGDRGANGRRGTPTNQVRLSGEPY